MSEEFKCKKCGYCCRSLFGFSDGWLKGLSLTKNETQLFDQKLVFPQWAVGTNGPEYVYQYQLGLAVCPYISENNECAIYEKRPLKCRAYPFELLTFRIDVKENVLITIECPQSHLKKHEEILNDCEKLYNCTMRARSEHYKKGMRLWCFDLATKKWMSNKEYYL